jgi:MerR family transcriptional regulator, repressor of the yfmOP operon
MVTDTGNLPTSHIQDREAVPLRIGDLAARTGLTQRTIRYYEELRLLPAPGRTEGDYRLYTEDDVARLLKIVRLRDLLGFTLAEVREILTAEETVEELKSQYREADNDRGKLEKLEQALGVLDGEIALVDNKVSQLLDLRRDLEAKLERYRGKREQLRGRIEGES